MKKSSTTTSTKRLTRSGWLQLGLEALAEDGPDALTVEALCARAKRTRGSFYHHFPATDYFIKQMADEWQRTHTQYLIAATADGKNVADQLNLLNELAISLDPRIEQGIRALAARNKNVATILEDVDKTRVAYLANLYVRSDRYNQHEAETMAKIEYAAFVGMQLIYPDDSPAKRLALHSEFLKLTNRK